MSPGLQSTRSGRRLVVVMLDPLTPIIRKGEIVERYHNPGHLFDEVHFVLLNADNPDPAALQPLVGRARSYVHNIVPPPGMMLRTLGWRPSLLRPFATRVVNIVRSIRPDAVRALNPWIDGFCCAEIKRQLGTPFVLSLHGNPDLDYRGQKRPEGGVRGFVNYHTLPSLERIALKSADRIICVYRYILPYARRHNPDAALLVYNAVSTSRIAPKEDYRLGSPPRMLVLGRQLRQKNPMPVIEAMASIPQVHCDLIGTGPIHEDLKATAARIGVASRTKFMPSMPNAEICAKMSTYDMLISVNDYGGVSKVELEAATAGIPIVTNLHPLESEPEVLGEHCIGVTGDSNSYAGAIRRLLQDGALRERLGKGVRTAVADLDGATLEQQLAAAYSCVMSRVPA